MGLLDGKRLLITGVITDASLAFHAAKIAQEQGAQVVLTGFGRMRLVERIAQRLPEPAPVVELDVSDQAQLDSLVERVSPHLGEDPRLDGVLHSIGFAPSTCLGEGGRSR
jgi:enoyl-[acyl-carrier protein] reductase I